MTEKEIKKLTRRDLLVLLAEQTARADRFANSLQKAERELMDRRVAIGECGSMAEASLRLNDVFKSADEAAAQFVENARQRYEDQVLACQRMEEESRQKAAEINQKAEKDADRKRMKAENIVRQAKETAEQEKKKSDEYRERMIRQAEKEAEKIRNQANEYLSQAQEKAAEEKRQAEEMLRQTQETIAQENAKLDARWKEIYAWICNSESYYSEMRSKINGGGDSPKKLETAHEKKF